MSEGIDPTRGRSEAGTGEDGSAGTVGTAANEAGAVAGVATDAAKDVLHTAKDEAASVTKAAGSQVKDLYAQGRTQLSDQASQQQGRLAEGLRAAGGELEEMARNADGGGVATDLVQQVSTRLSGAAQWLADREPADVLDEVKRFARRRPLLFIAGAAVAGVVAGRLVRALSSAQHDEAGSTGGSARPSLPASATDASATTAPPVPPLPAFDAPVEAPAVVVAEPVGDSPLYDSAAQVGGARREDEDERSDTL
jgi:hypothetical protein